MKFGACIGTDPVRLRILSELGYDYAESGCGSLCAITEEEFQEFLKVKEELDFPVIVANGFFPRDIKLAGPESDKQQIRDYLTKLFGRTDKLGIKRIIFGSGRARDIPDCMSREDGIKEIIFDLKEIICPMAAEHGIEIVIEPLRTQESNILNTVHEGIEMMDIAGIDNLKVLADVYHMVCMDEPFDYLAGLKGRLVHAHTSTPIGGDERRVYPKRGDGFDQRPFIQNLIAAGVETCSLEAGAEDYRAEAEEALKVLKAAL